MAVLWHFAATRTLTTPEKRTWIRGMTGGEAWLAFSEFMASPDLERAFEGEPRPLLLGAP